jgi:quinohemoprotein ethanol dehydrogenase
MHRISRSPAFCCAAWIFAAGTVDAAGGVGAPPSALTAADVDGRTIGLFEQPADVWLSHGRTYGEQRYSPLDQINRGNLGRVGQAWEADLESPRFGIEATPIAVGGVLYTTAPYGVTYAFDARTGRQLWRFDPHGPHDWIRWGCCGPMNRGVALWKGRVYVASYEGRLFALDAKSGQKRWEVNTTQSQPGYSITGAPLVVKGLVIIGNAGGEFATRGYVSAYEADTGRLAWRFYTVPGDPRKGFENPELAAAAQTWGPNHDWSLGGDGNPWNALSYDPETDLLFVGTANGPWVDQPDRNIAKGDNLYTCSILALHASTGRLAWYYQETPGDKWDFDATQNIVLADLRMNGQVRKVLMQAPKSGFFYVIDRQTGKLISANNFVRVNWASHIDLKTGRPVLLPENADYLKGPKLVFPSPAGATNWMGMAYDPTRQLVYLSAHDIGWAYGLSKMHLFYEGFDVSTLTHEELRSQIHGLLEAWDPIANKPVWRVIQKSFTNSGLLATAGGIVVQGTEDGFIQFRDSSTGKLLREIAVGTGIVAPPISYALDGVQYIAVGVGFNGAKVTVPRADTPPPFDKRARLIVLKLGGGPVKVAQRVPVGPLLNVEAAQRPAMVAQGENLYARYCFSCHWIYGEYATYPDLLRMSKATYDDFYGIVLGGERRQQGMASFATDLKPADAEAIRAYLVDLAQRVSKGATPR